MKLRYFTLLCGIGLAVAPSCGGDSQRVVGRDKGEAGAGGEATGGDSGAHLGGSSVTGGDGGSALGGGNAEAGAGGLAGDAAGGLAGEGGASGGEAGAAQAGAAGSTSVVDTSGEPEGAVTLSDTHDLTVDALASGRACAEAPAYSVTALSASSATLTATPESGCLSSGDEVLLINLQGSPSSYVNTGNWELLKIESVDGAVVTFTSNKRRHYGADANSDGGLGVDAGSQRVALVRVPHFDSLTVPSDTTLTAAPWSGALGGVLALRADQVEVAGTITAASLGYRGGRWSRDDQNCSDNIDTEAGESIGGLGIATTMRNIGASGGIAAKQGISFNTDSPACASAGHALPGQAGFNDKTRMLGEPGATYGADDASKLTLGSGPGGNVTCDNDSGREPYLADFNIRAGGIVLLLVGTLNVTETGVISATPPDPTRDVAPSGGYVHIRGTSLSLGDERVTAQGAYGRSVNGPAAGQSNRGGAGYVVLSGDVTGLTDPPAKVLP